MIRRIKYRLLEWLLNDICIKSDCEKCDMTEEIDIDGYKGGACMEMDVFRQARKVWGL